MALTITKDPLTLVMTAIVGIVMALGLGKLIKGKIDESKAKGK